MTREMEAMAHIDALIKLAGFDQSESSTMCFIEVLDEAATRARDEIRESVRQGLCLDCRWIVADTILNSTIPKTWQEREEIAAKE